MAAIYGDVDLVDAWIGGLAEESADGLLGETFALIVADQFERLRDGDAYWSQAGGLSQEEVTGLWDTGLADIIERNSDVGTIQDEIFYSYQRLGGDDGRDKLVGEDGRDLLLGFAGNDRLTGKNGDDQLSGGKGNDRLDGGKGDDVLEGGQGKDTFAFTLKSGDDRVVDFEAGDRVVIKDICKTFNIDKALHQDGDDVMLKLSKNASVLFEDLSRDELDTAAFLFG